ncbi:MAG: TonB-dependent receptor domain-containing protein, partial [Blastocatellia bacterium]
NQPSLALRAENVQEFREATGISSAEFTRGGSQVTAVTRAGSNNWHGSAFWFHRNTIFDANDFFNNIAGQERPPLLRHQFGGRVGGPIWKDRAFFFFGYQQTRERRGIPVHRVVWSPLARQGIFQWMDSGGALRQVNLLACGAAVQAVLTRDCVDSRFNSASPEVGGASSISTDAFVQSNVIANMPTPNIAGGDGLNTQGFRFNADTLTFEHLPSFRLDYRINDKHLFYGSWNYTDRNIVGDFINGREPVWPTLGALGTRVTHANGFSGTLVSNFTPTTVNEFRIGRVGAQNRFGRNQPFNVPWTLDFDDISDPYDFDGGAGSFRNNVTWHLRDSYSLVWRNHQFKFGGEWRKRLVDNVSFAEVLELGEIDFNDSDSPPGFSGANLQALAGASSAPGSGDLNNAEELLNNLIGYIGSVEARYTVNNINATAYEPFGTPERRIYQNREFDVFVQDNWNLRSNLSLNLGVRWEWAGVPDEKNGLILLPEGGADGIFGNSGPAGLFTPGTLSGKPCAILGSAIANPTGANLDTLFDTCAVANVPGGGKNGLPLYKNDFNNFGPVVGVAWDPWGTGKTSIRAGYRISYAQDVFSVIDGNVDDNAGLLLNHDCAPLDGTCQNNLGGGTAGNHPLLRDIVDSSGNVILSGPSPVRSPPASFTLPVVTHIQNTGDTALDLRAFARNLGTEY